MQILKSIDSSFNNASLRVKIQLYILPLLLVYLMSFYLNTKAPAKLIKNVDYESMQMNKSMLSITKEFEKFCEKKSIQIKYIKYENKTIYLKGHASFSNIKKLISYIDGFNSFSKINSLDFFKEGSKYRFSLKVDFDKFYLKNTEKNKIKEGPSNKQRNLKVKAIIDNHVLINNRWLNKNESINGHRILEIKANKVLLEKNGKKLYLKVYENEKFVQ